MADILGQETEAKTETAPATAAADATAATTTATAANATAATTATDSTPASSAKGFLAGTDGALAANWRESLPAEIKGAKSLDAIKSVQALAMGYVSAQKLVGADRSRMLSVPSDKATPEEWGKVYDALGRPKTAADYQSPEDIQFVDDAQKTAINQRFFDAGLSQKQVDAVLGVYRDAVKQSTESEARDQEITVQELKKEWGFTYGEKINAANAALKQTGMLEALKGSPLLNDGKFIRCLAALGEHMGESKLAAGSAAPDTSVDDKISEIKGNPKDPYFDPGHPAHAARVAEMARLLALKQK